MRSGCGRRPSVADRLRQVHAAAAEGHRPVRHLGTEAGSGYPWYEVSPISFKVKGLVEWPQTIIGDGMTGWVPAADRDREAWLAHGDAACPPAPRDVESLARLTIGARLACFSQVPITLQARLLQHGCDVDWSGEIEAVVVPGRGPTDLTLAARHGCDRLGEELTVGCDTDRPVPASRSRWDTASPPRLPLDEVVTVTGTFDHPTAAGCRFMPYGLRDRAPATHSRMTTIASDLEAYEGRRLRA